MIPTFSDYDLVVINTSGGKDSQAMTEEVVAIADKQGYSRKRLVLAHADLGRIEWDNTIDVVRGHADHYGLRLVVEKRPQGDLLAHFRKRWEDLKAQGKTDVPPWASPTNRFCTSDHKRGQIGRAYTYLTRELGVKDRKAQIINCFGFRAEESPARAKREVWAKNNRASTKTTRDVWDWLPIHHWLEDDVWLKIDEAGTKTHWAYDRGMGRLSCRFCIFAPRNQLMIAAIQPENWDLFLEYVAFEVECGFTFTQSVSLLEIKEAIERGEKPTFDDNGAWDM